MDIVYALAGFIAIMNKLKETTNRNNELINQNTAAMRQTYEIQKRNYEQQRKNWESEVAGKKWDMGISEAILFDAEQEIQSAKGPAKGKLRKEIEQWKHIQEKSSQELNLLKEKEPSGIPIAPDVKSVKSSSGAGGAAASVALAIYSAMKKLFDEFMQPGADLTKELKNAGLPSLVKSFNIAAEPLLDMTETINEALSPVFFTMIEKIATSIDEQLPKIEATVDKFVQDGTFDSIGDSVAELVANLPSMIQLWLKFAAINWDAIITFFINHGDTIITMLTGSLSALEKIYDLMNMDYRDLLRKLLGDEQAWGGSGNYYNRGDDE